MRTIIVGNKRENVRRGVEEDDVLHRNGAMSVTGALRTGRIALTWSQYESFSEMFYKCASSTHCYVIQARQPVEVHALTRVVANFAMPPG